MKENVSSLLFFSSSSSSSFLDSSCYSRRKRKKKRKTKSCYYSIANTHTTTFINIHIHVILAGQEESCKYPGESKMIEIMDTYNHDDIHHQYGKIGNYKNNSMLMTRISKKVNMSTW
jgi:hypothetical protein